MNLTPFQGFLAALADSDFSAIFYLAALFQLVVLVLGSVARFKATPMYAVAAGVSHLLLPLSIAAGFYFATRAVA